MPSTILPGIWLFFYGGEGQEQQIKIWPTRQEQRGSAKPRSVIVREMQTLRYNRGKAPIRTQLYVYEMYSRSHKWRPKRKKRLRMRWPNYGLQCFISDNSRRSWGLPLQLTRPQGLRCHLKGARTTRGAKWSNPLPIRHRQPARPTA